MAGTLAMLIIGGPDDGLASTLMQPAAAQNRLGPPKSSLLTANTSRSRLMLLANRSRMEQRKNEQAKNDLLPGTLNLMILRTLESLGPLHGYGIARRIEQI